MPTSDKCIYVNDQVMGPRLAEKGPGRVTPAGGGVSVEALPPSSTPNVTYNVLKASSQTGPFTSVQTGLTALTFTDANLPANTQVCYEVTASAAGMADSDPSNVVCGTTGQDKASAPGALIIVVK